MEESKKLTIGVIGLGSIGLRHKTNLWQHLGQTEVVGYDPDPDKLQSAGWVCGDLKIMLEMCDLAIIASPTFKHWDHICDATMAGCKIFVEKPIAHKELLSAPSNVLMVGYNLRFHSCVKEIKAWLTNNPTFSPLWANFTLGQHNAKSPYLRDGVILNWSHEVDLALYLLGPGSFAGSTTRLTDGRDDITDIFVTHMNGCRTTIHLDYVTRPELRSFTIVGQEGRIHCNLVSRHVSYIDQNGKFSNTYTGNDNWNENYIEEMQAFLDRANHGLDTIGCTADEAIEVLKICLATRQQAGL